MNFIKLYIGDYQRDTGHLSIAEHGAYLLMLQHYYATEKPLPKGKPLHRLLRAETKDDRDAIESIVTQFWTETETGLINERADEEILKASHQRTVNQEIGKRGGRPRKTDSVIDEETDSVIGNGTESKPNSNPNQTPDTMSPSLRSGDTANKSRTPRQRRETTTLSQYLEACRAAKVKPVPDDHAVRAYCRDAGIADEMLQIAWLVFKDRHLNADKDKRYKDWATAFANSVKDRWYKLWYDDAGEVKWTSTGLQEKRVIEARLAERQQHDGATA